MKEKLFETPCGKIHYWTNEKKAESDKTLVFLPGLTADHRLFDKQIGFFEERYRVLVWDPPEHAASWPFDPSFSLWDKARWLDGILQQEGIDAPVIVGQSMGGYVGQMFAQLFPEKLKGFISIDSAPLRREYVTAAELWLLKRMEPVYRHYPWRFLLKSGAAGVAESEYGRKLMHDIMMDYDGDRARYWQRRWRRICRMRSDARRFSSAAKRTVQAPVSASTGRGIRKPASRLPGSMGPVITPIPMRRSSSTR